MEPHIVGCLGQQVLEVRAIQSRRDVVLLVIIECAKAFFELERFPDPPPALDSPGAREERDRPVFE